jgi:hypothetical protein
MLDVEFIEELLCIILEGEQDKKDSLDEFCEKYSSLNNKSEDIRTEFESVLRDIDIIFSEIISMPRSRFRQHADFYSLFGCILDFQRQELTIISENLQEVRSNLVLLDDQIEPHSNNEKFSEYAIKCISDANSLSTRQWRKAFLKSYMKTLYCGKA